MTYIRIRKFSELSGYSENAVRCKIKKGVWIQDKHWIKAPDGFILLNTHEIIKWFQGDITV